MYDFDKVIDRRGTTSIKWNEQDEFGQPNGLLPFWIADTDFPVADEITAALKKRCEHPVFGYADPTPDTFRALQGWWERRHGWKPETDWMFITCGVVMGIYFAMEAFLEKGDRVLTFTPVYDPFFAAVRNSGHTLVECPLEHRDNYYTIDWALFEKELRGGVKAVIFCNPHNPVGRVWSAQELERVASLCADYGVYLLCDEVHCDYALTRPYTPMGRFPQILDRLVIFTAPSKSFNLAGLVAACIMVPDPTLRKKLRYEFDSRWMFGPTDFAFTAMEAAYGHADVWMDEVQEYLRGNVTLVQRFAAENLPGVALTRHEGTFLMWLDMRSYHLTSDELTATLARDYAIALGNGGHYGSNADGFMRFNIGCPRETLQQGLDALARFCRDRRV